MSKQSIQAAVWVFTVNNHTEEDVEQIIAWMGVCCSQWTMQEERGATGTMHLQGVLRMRKKVRFEQLKNEWPKWHIQKCKGGKKAWEYCMKDDTATGRNWGTEERAESLWDDPLWAEWQFEVVRIAKSDRRAARRDVNWYWSDAGKTGKSSMATWLMDKMGAVLCTGNARDMKCQIALKMKDSQWRPKICVWDVPRHKGCCVTWDGIEELKDGRFFSGKYESTTCRFNAPHVFVFANVPPPTAAMSEDRWNIVCLDEGLPELEVERGLPAPARLAARPPS